VPSLRDGVGDAVAYRSPTGWKTLRRRVTSLTRSSPLIASSEERADPMPWSWGDTLAA
jgi:hypothetical protein